MEPLTAPTLDLEGFLRALREAALPPETPVLVAVGGWGVEGHDRIGLVVLDGAPPRVLADAYLPARDVDKLVKRMACARPRARTRQGGWNTMHLTGWSFLCY
jgi:hypothetical protein